MWIYDKIMWNMISRDKISEIIVTDVQVEKSELCLKSETLSFGKRCLVNVSDMSPLQDLSNTFIGLSKVTLWNIRKGLVKLKVTFLMP